MAKHFAIDPDGKHLPVKLDSTSNGEFFLSVRSRRLRDLERAPTRQAPAAPVQLIFRRMAAPGPRLQPSGVVENEDEAGF